jgi:hypothetical protein
MILWTLIACTGVDDSAKTDTASGETDSGDSADSVTDTGTTPVGPLCSTWLGFEEGRVWTHMLRDAGNDTTATITASLLNVDLDAGVATWFWSQDVDRGEYRELEEITYDIVCTREDGATRTGGILHYEYHDDVDSVVTESVFTYTPAYVLLPPDFGPSATWDVEVQIDQVVDGEPSSGVNHYRLQADPALETVETWGGPFDALRVSTTDVNAGVTIDAEWFADGYGLVATEFTTVSEIVTF